MEIEKAIEVMKKFHDSVLLENWSEFCIDPIKFQNEGVPTKEFGNSQYLRYAVEISIQALEKQMPKKPIAIA